MKVLVVHNRYRSSAPGGEDRVVDQETAALVGAGHSVERFERLNDDIANFSPVRKAMLPATVVWSEEARRGLTRALRSTRPDVVHVHNTFPLVSPSILYSCRAERIPVVATLHNYRLVCASGILFRDGRICHDCLGRSPLPGVRHGCYKGSAVATIPSATGMIVHHRAWRRMVSAYVCPSETVRQIVRGGGLPMRRLFVKYHFVPSLPTTPRQPGGTVVYAGRLDVVKGIDLLLEAWDMYVASRNENGGLRLVIMGSGPLSDRVAGWAAQRPSVDFLGMRSRVECAAMLASACAAVVPSMWEEVFGLVIIEAMALGVPSVASAHGAFPELIEDGVDGVLFPPGSALALADVLGDIESHPDRFAAMGRAGRRTYDRRFTPEVSISELEKIYEFAIGNPA